LEPVEAKADLVGDFSRRRAGELVPYASVDLLDKVARLDFQGADRHGVVEWSGLGHSI